MAFGKTMGQQPLGGAMLSALTKYKGEHYIEYNQQLRGKKAMTEGTAKILSALTQGIHSGGGKVPKNTVLYRGVKNYADGLPMHPKEAAQTNYVYSDPGFMSCSTNKDFASGWSGPGHNKNAIVYEIKIARETEGVHVGVGKGSTNDGEYEVVLQRSNLWKCVGYREEAIAGGHQHVITVELI
jgi:hypothetical protein